MVCEGVVAGVAFRRTDLCELLKTLRRNKNARAQPTYKTSADLSAVGDVGDCDVG